MIKVHVKYEKNQQTFIDYSQTINDVYENLEDYNPTKKRKVLIVFDNMISDIEANKKFSPVVTELFIRERKLNISLVFVSQSYFKVSKDIRLNVIHFIMKISNKKKLQKIASSHSSGIEFKDFMKLCKDVIM